MSGDVAEERQRPRQQPEIVGMSMGGGANAVELAIEWDIRLLRDSEQHFLEVEFQKGTSKSKQRIVVSKREWDKAIEIAHEDDLLNWKPDTVEADAEGYTTFAIGTTTGWISHSWEAALNAEALVRLNSYLRQIAKKHSKLPPFWALSPR